jgi:hypothetical protein
MNRPSTSSSKRRIRISCWIASSSFLAVIALLILIIQSSSAFTATPTNNMSTTSYYHHRATSRAQPSSSGLFYNNQGSGDDAAFDLDLLQQRITELKLTMLEDDLQRPPNAKLSPKAFVDSIFQGLLHNEEPFPSSGFKRLLQCSTDQWKNNIYQSIGAPVDANVEVVAAALGDALGRPQQQFAILVGEEDDNNFYISFPSEELDFFDGTCWIECVLRDKRDGSLMVVTGWSLRQRQSDGAWLVDRIDWQDFREAYRPGIGREEWMPFEG